MKLTKLTYVPSIRWRMGEYGALSQLDARVKECVVPFVTIPAIEYDFEEEKPKTSVQDHVEPFVRRLTSKWGAAAWVGVHDMIAKETMADGSDVFTYVFNELRSELLFAWAVPAIPLCADARVVRSVAAIISHDKRGLGLSIRLEDLMRGDVNSRLNTLSADMDIDETAIDLFIDLAAPNFEPYCEFATSLTDRVATINNLERYRNFILLSTAWPESNASIRVGMSDIERHDWLFYKVLVESHLGDLRHPSFGDYTVVHPAFRAVDMRTIKSAGKLVYTDSDRWWIRKGVAFRDHPEQMHEHCAALSKMAIFKGASYSQGDEYIRDCAIQKVTASNLTRWKQVAINHHITHVVDDLASFFGAT